LKQTAPQTKNTWSEVRTLEETMKLLIGLQACDVRINEKLALKEWGPDEVKNREEDLAEAEALLQE
jgi:hypothetical protein